MPVCIEKPRTRGRARIRESDVTKAIRGAERAGLKITAIEAMPDGGFRLLTSKSTELETKNEWNEVLE
jgi:hypothetical protein